MPFARSLLCAALALPLPALVDLGINLYGLSYHFDRSRARELGVDNGFNPGLGVLRCRRVSRFRAQHVPQSEKLACGALALFDSDT